MNSAFDEVVHQAGGLKSLADKLGERSIQVVSNWRSRGFPANRCKAISRLTGVSLQRLRPQDWHDYWPELGEQTLSATPVGQEQGGRHAA